MQPKTLSLLFASLCLLMSSAVLGAPVEVASLQKRTYASVHHAVQEIHTAHKADEANAHAGRPPHPAYVGHGTKGNVYSLKDKYKGKDAVVKVIDNPHNHDSIHKEVQNLHHVNQLLDHAYDKDKNRHYIIMKNKGISAQAAKKKDDKLTDAHLSTLASAAHEKYKTKYGMEQSDTNPGNFVFNKKHGNWKANVVDWDRTRNPAKPHVNIPVHEVAPGTNRLCPTCVIQ